MRRTVSPFGSREDQERFRKLKPLEQLRALQDLIEQVEEAADEARPQSDTIRPSPAERPACPLWVIS